MDFRIDAGNTPLDPTEAEGLIVKVGTQGELNLVETRNIVSAIVWARSNRQVQAKLLNPATLKLIHQQMFGKVWSWAGRYRVTQKSIGIEAFRISTEMKNLTENATTWIEFGTYSTLEIATRFHHRLVQIHPFPNGNGRHARFVTDLLCHHLKIEPFTWGANLNEEKTEVRRRYIAALQSADSHDFGDLLSFVRA